MIYKMYKWWEDQKRLSTTAYYMIVTFLSLLFVCVCIGLMAIPVVLTATFNCWCWLLLWMIMLPLCVGAGHKLIEFVS